VIAAAAAGQLVVLFFSSLLVAYSGALMPGPMLTAVVVESPRHGAKAGPLVVLGHAILELVLLGALVLGLGHLLERGSFKAAIALIGGAMLVWTATAMIVTVARDKVDLDWQAEAPGRRMRIVLSGVLSSLSNPYWTIWWATIGLGLLTKAYAYGVAGVAVFYVGHILGDLTWYSVVSGTIAAGRRFITLRGYKMMLCAAAAFLLALAAWFIVSGVRFVS
jgi:threonine/homoserine/homoserine lactone efflux protein